jgi:repressor LexA
VNTRDRILAYVRECDYSPTVREIMDVVGLKSPSSVHAHLNQLRRDGLIEYEGRRIVVKAA